MSDEHTAHRTHGDERAALEGRVVRELLVVDQLMTTRLNRALRPLELTLTQLSLLSHLAQADGPQAVSAIARSMEINQPGVSKVVVALAERGAVEVRADPGDARIRQVHLTSAGKRLLDDARRQAAPASAIALGAIEDDELAALLALLAATRERLDAARGK